jgi:hypothetical protein
MSTGALIGIVIAVIVIATVGVVVAQELRRARLRRQFGPEYTRLAKELGSNRKAESELLARQRRAAKLDLKPLTAEQQAGYARDWTGVQERFVDAPAETVTDASSLVERVMRQRGYPADDHNEIIVVLSVYHARKLDSYRRGWEVSKRIGAASTEDLRKALLDYRELFNDLVGAARNRLPRPPQASAQVTPPQTKLTPRAVISGATRRR